MREPFITLVFGMTGVGKTYFTLKYVIEKYVEMQQRPVLILDVNNEFNGSGDFGPYKAIAYDVDEEDEAERVKYIRSIKKPAIYRILARYKNGLEYEDEDMVRAAVDIFMNFRNGLFLLEDINAYITTSVPKGFYSRLTRARHSGVDIIIHYQNIGDPHPKILKNTSIVRLHKTGDSVTTFSTDKYKDHYEMFRICEHVVNHEFLNGNKLYNCYLNLRERKILNVTQEQFKKACALYLSENQSQFRNIKMQRDMNGKLIYNTDEEVFQNFYLQKSKLYLS